MTDPNRQSLNAARAWFDSWQHVVLTCVFLGAAVAAGAFIPLDRLEKLGRFVSDPATAVTLTALGGVCVTLYRRARGLPPSLLPLVLALGLASSGCGASALALQARAATVVGVGLGSARGELHDARAAELDACPDVACVDAGEARWAPAVAAYESARAALVTWVEALDVARQAGEDEGILAALLVAVGRLAREWADLAAALAPLGVELARHPAEAMAALLGGASRE